ncbi:hypothetical protein D3C80_2083690 [compost metagenome]
MVEEGGERYALIAQDGQAPVIRYTQGDALPGGERLERIDVQGIRFSLPQDGEGKDFERKLYAPLE